MLPFNKALLIIPTYNEIDNIDRMLSTLIKLYSDLNILIIDDGSPDGTAEVVKGYQKKNSHIHLKQRSGKLGLGTAYIAGFKWALERDFEFVFEMDCDFSHNPEDLKVFRKMKKVWPRKDVRPSNILDFGCGTGRLSLALSSFGEQVTGVDVSEAMLTEAEKNKHEQNISNVTFVNIPDCPPFLKEKYDFIYSEIVFQHIPTDKGMLTLDHLLDHLLPGGSALLQLTYNNLSSPKEKRIQRFIFTFPRLRRLLTGSKDYFFPMFD